MEAVEEQAVVVIITEDLEVTALREEPPLSTGVLQESSYQLTEEAAAEEALVMKAVVQEVTQEATDSGFMLGMETTGQHRLVVVEDTEVL